MKLILLLCLLGLIAFLCFLIYQKINHKKEEEKLAAEELEKPKFDISGNEIIEKEEFISRLRYDIVELSKYVDGIIEKDNDDEINHSNLIKALVILDNQFINDNDVQMVIDLRIFTENYYNL